MSDNQRHLLQDEGFSKATPKLVPNLSHKTNYIIHYCNLKSQLELGSRLTKVHRVLSFDRLPWLISYINFNTRQPTAAKNDFEKDFFKLMNNAVFGESFFIFMFICSFTFLCIDWFIHSFIVGKISIFMFICSLCSYVSIHLLEVKQWKTWGIYAQWT